MMNKLKIMLCLMVCVGVLGCAAATARNNSGADETVVAAGRNSLKRSELVALVEFYEWMFDEQFTGDEREKLQSFIARDFRRNAASARRDADAVLTTFAQIRALDADAQRRTRELAVPDFVADLRKSADDDDSQLLLGIYERTRNDRDRGTVAEVLPEKEAVEAVAAPAKSSTGGAGASQLVGRWLRSGGAGGARDHTGKTLYNSGNDVIFEFFADGTMNFINEKNTLSITQCRISEVTKIPGRYSASGDTLTMNLAPGTVVGKSSCEAQGNFKKSLDASTLTKTFVVKRLESLFRPDAPQILCLDGSGDDQCFEKTGK